MSSADAKEYLAPIVGYRTPFSVQGKSTSVGLHAGLVVTFMIIVVFPMAFTLVTVRTFIPKEKTRVRRLCLVTIILAATFLVL